jgi:general secretion pathway protein D/MSHA biogenesis protein MshL
MISVGRNVTYIKKVTSTYTAGTGTTAGTYSFTAEPGSILSGVGLGLTATILDNNEIVMDLVPVTSELEEGTENGVIVAGEGATAIKMGLPVVNIREMSTTVRVKDGEMLVIGGLISDIAQTDGNFAPVVGDIPLIKYLFGHEEKVKHKRELIILLKPHII